MNDELVERQAAYNLHFLPLPGRANDRETQMARLQDYMIADRDEDAAKRVRDYYGEGVPVGSVSEKAMQYFVGAAMARNLGISGAPEAYWLGREKPEALPEVEQQDDLYTEMGRDLITKTQDAWVKQQVKLQERRQTLGTVLQQIVQEGEANKKESAAWLGFLDAQGRGVWSEDEAVSLVKATEAFSMMRGLVDDPQSAGANVLTKGSTGQLIFDALYGDEMATGLFFSALQDRIADMKTAEEERNALVQFAHAFEAATKNLTAGMMGGHFRTFVTDEQVDEYNAVWEKARKATGVENPNVERFAEGDNWFEKMLPVGNARLAGVRIAANKSGQKNADGSLRKMTDEERRSTQELNEFRGQLHNAVQGVYDIDGLAKLGKMMPGSLAYLVPGGMLASAMSMRTHDLASQLGEGSDWVSANARATVNAAIQAGVEKMAFGSIKATKMAPGLDALMSTGPMARVFGKLYGTTAGRIGVGVVAGGLEETFAEPAAGLLLSGIYNAFAPTGLELDSPLVAYKNEMAEMLEPDQILATSLYGLLLGGVNVPGHRAEAKHYKKVVEGLERIGIDHNVAANMARRDGSLQQIAAGVQQVDAALKKDAGGVFGYIAELYPQLQEISTFENLMRAYNLPKMLPGEGGNVRVQYKDEDGKVQELVMSQEAGRLFVQARIEQLGSKVQVGFADMVLGQVMTGKVAEKSDSWVVSVEDADMNADYFRRIAAAAGIRLSQGAKATDIVPEIHPYIPLGTLAQQGRAWESRMRVARGEAEEKLGRKLTDEEWAQREKQLVSRVNRVRVASQDGRVRTVLRVARGGYGAMEVLEDVTEDFLSLDMEENGRELGWYADNLLELERALGRQGAFLHELKEGESYDRMAIIEGVGKLVQSKVLADTTRKYKLGEKLNAFLDMIRHLVQRAVAMLKLGKAINKVLADKEASAKLDPEFVGMVDRLVEKDVEFLRELQLEDGLAAMQRVLEQRVPSTPVLAEAEAKHGAEVREEMAAKAAAQAKVDADVAEGEAAVDGSMSTAELAENQVKIQNKAIVTFVDGVVRDKRSRVLRSDGSEVWARFPEIEELKNVGFPAGDVVLEVGSIRGGYLHLAIRHGEEIQALYPGVSLLQAIELFIDEVFSNLGKARGSYVGKGKKRKMDVDSKPYEGSTGAKRKKRVSLSFHKAPNAQFYTIDTAFEAAEDKDFTKVRVEKDGQSCTVTVELDGKAPGLPTGATLNPSSARPLHAHRPGEDDDITAESNVKGEDIAFEFLRKIQHPDEETGARVKDVGSDATLSVAEAEETGLFDGGVLEASNAVVTAPSFSVVGEGAANWEEIKHLAFRGRDDGKLRVELDSSQARLKKAPLHRMDVSLVREVDRRLAFFRDELEKKKRWETVRKLWSAGEYDLRTYDEMDFLRRVLRGAGIEFRNLPQMVELGVCAMVLDGDGAKRLLKVVDMPGVEGFNQLGEVLDFPELFEAYPELKKLPVRWMDDTFRYKGSYLTGGRFSEPFILARRNRKEGGKLSTLLHEAQHWIQHHEDFAFGSVPGGAKDYKVSAGEIEARNVQARRWLSAEERAALPFNETLTHPGTAEAYSVAALAGSMSVVGASAANWDKIKHRAFKGRDDGKLRVEIDASQAKIKNLGVSDEYAEQEAGMLLRKVDKFVEGLSAEKRELLEKYIEVYNSDFPDEEREAAIKEERRLEEANKETLDSLHAELGGMVERMWIESILPGVDYREHEMRAQVREYYEKNIKLDERRYLGDVLDFEALYEAYPKLRYTPVSFRRLGTGTNAQVERRNGKDYIVIHEGLLRCPEGEMLRTLLHEVQHVIQGIEGFAQGGNEDYANELALMRESVEPEKYGWVLNKSPYELYRRLAGEVEARNVQRRMWYSEVEREMLPFNSTMDIPEYETLVSFSLSPTLMEDIARARKRAKNADGTISQDGEMPRGAEVPLCSMPDFMRFLGEADVPIVARVFTLRKLLTDHKLTDALTYEVVQKMNDPVLAIQETPSTYLVLLDVQAENKDGVMAPVVCAVEHKKGKDGNRYLVSAYSLDNDKERKITQQFKKLVYCKYNTTAKFTADAPQGRAYDLLRAAISGGHTRNVATYEDVVKGKENSSYSIVDLNGEEFSHLVAVAGSGMKANEAFVEKMMAEIRGSLLRMRKLGSKTRTDREDALVAMGGISQMVKALGLSLPQGYRFAVQPYMNKLDVLTELATTGNVEMLRENVSKGLQAWMDETSENWHEVLPQLSGNENMTREELTARVQEMMKEHAGQQLTEAVERIVERVAGQLRKHAKDTAVKRMRELLERVMPKKDPKSGKLKGGKMGADDYRDLEDVQAALDMNAEKLEAKMAALKAEMETPGLSEEKRDEKEALLMLYDQFGDPDSMSAEEAVAAYEALRQRIWMSRFEWENIQSEKRAARRAVVRRIVEGVGSVSENEYNAKKRRVKPTKRMKNLGDVLAGMPAAVGALRGYLPLREMADSLTRRANRAGELIKEWEAERWIALEALSKQTLGKSWRLSMDYMHKVLPTGVAFERPVYRTVDIKVPALRELLQMDAKARVAEMKRRREAGGKEAETALSERDIEAAAKELERMDEAGEVKGWVHTRYLKELRREENLQLSRGEALYAILMYEQPTYTERMEAQGYTPEVVAGLKKFIGDGMLEFGYGLRELFRIQGDKIAAIYEREFGVPFPREENYFAARWDVTEMKENPAEQLLAGMAGTPGAGNGWMKTRVNHELELDMTKDALQVFLQATTLTDTWMATQDIVADFKAWTRDKDFARALTALLGEESYTNLKDWIRILEQGGAQDCLNMGVSQDVINGLYGSGAVAILGLRVQTLIRQVPSVFNGMLGASDITAGEWFATLARMKHGDAPMTFKRMKDSVLMKNRRQGRAGNMASQAVRSGDTDSSVTEEFLLASMLPMEWMDASCTAMSLVPVWNVYYDRAVRKGANHQEAEQAAWEQTTVVANLASQPIGWLNKSKIAQSRNPIVKSMFYMLSENTAKFALCRALWKGRNKMAAVRAWLVYGAANAAISALLDYLQGDPDEWEKGEWWEYVLSALYGPAASLPGVGEALEALGTLVFFTLPGHVFDIEALKKAKTRASVGRALIDVGGTWRAMQKLYEFMTDDKEHTLAEYTRAASTVSRTLAIGTGWMGNMVGYWSTALAVLTNPVDFVARVYRNMKQYYEEE